MTKIQFAANRGSGPGGPLVRERKGAMLVLVAVVLVVLLGFLTLTLDVGSGNRQRRMAQTAADAGALAGAVELYRLQGSPFNVRHDSAVNAAIREVVRNGFLASDIVAPCPCNPPVSGPHTGNNGYIEVVLSRNTPSIFGSIFGFASLTAGARGVGGVTPFAQNCLVALDPSGNGALSVTNGGSLSTTFTVDGHEYSCSISVNSSSQKALDLNQSGVLDAGSGSIGVQGDWSGNANKVSPDPVTGTPPVVDPLKDLVTMPTLTACDTNNLPTISKDTVLMPGVYCNGIRVDSKQTTLSPGVYYMAGGGFTAGTSAIIRGIGVTIVTTVDNISGFNYVAKGFNFSTGCKATLTPSTDPPFAGIVLYADPAMPTNTVNIFACASDDGPEITGTVYLPNQNITFDGSNAGTEISGSIIAGSITSSGKVEIHSDLSGNSVVKHPSLVE